MTTDQINPDHYKSSESGVECIEVTQFLDFPLGNAVKYLWRMGLKDPDALTDLYKTRWYIDRAYTIRPELGWVSFPSAPDYEDWATKFQQHIDTVENVDIQQCLSYCMASVSPNQTKRDLPYALEYLENAIRVLEQEKKAQQ